MNKKKVWSKFGFNKSFPYICTTNQERDKKYCKTLKFMIKT